MVDDVGKVAPTALKPDSVKQSRKPVEDNPGRKQGGTSPGPEKPANQAPKDDMEDSPPHLLDVCA
jgi:hypothetical protein